VYVADTQNYKIRKITPQGVVSTVAGTGIWGKLDGTSNVAMFTDIWGIAVDKRGNGMVYVTDSNNHNVRSITSQGVVSTLAGSGQAGSTDGAAAQSSFFWPAGLVTDAFGTIYIAGNFDLKIRIIKNGVVSTLAGTGGTGFADGPGSVATFGSWPAGVALDASGNIYVADSGNNKIRKIDSRGTVTTFAGSGATGSADGAAATASFNRPYRLAIDASGNLYVSDQSNNKIRKITPQGVVSTLAGTGAQGDADGAGAVATFSTPGGIAVDAAGNVYVADAGNHKIRKLVPQ
jgi:sugar lactone lactonase YvrE